MTHIEPSEVEMVGHWLVAPGGVVADDAARRIEELTISYLREASQTDDGWSVLYEDPIDGRYWELTYPQSEMHGGGPPRLVVLEASEAERRYELRPRDPG